MSGDAEGNLRLAVGKHADTRGSWALTRREQEVLQLAAEGLSIRETAGRLHLSPQTVKFHRTSVIQKMGVRNITHAVALAYQHGNPAFFAGSRAPWLNINGVTYVQADSWAADETDHAA